MQQEFCQLSVAEEFVTALINDGSFVISVSDPTATSGYIVRWIEHKRYTSHDGKEFLDETWLTEDGQFMLVQDIDPEHCRNILRMILRKERQLMEAYNKLSGILDPDDEQSHTSCEAQHVIH